MKRWLVLGTLLVVLPLAAAANCGKKCDPAMGDCNPRPPTPTPTQTERCLMTKDGCVSPRARS